MERHSWGTCRKADTPTFFFTDIAPMLRSSCPVLQKLPGTAYIRAINRIVLAFVWKFCYNISYSVPVQV